MITLPFFFAMSWTIFGDQNLPVAREPSPPDNWEQSSAFNCGETTLRISGYGNARPEGRITEITANNRAISGSGVGTLLRDLASRRAVYRLGVLCFREGTGMELRIASGEKTEAGNVIFRTGAAFIRNGELQHYTGLEDATADSFWFR